MAHCKTFFFKVINLNFFKIFFVYVLQEILFHSLYFRISCFMQFIYLTDVNLIVNRNCFEIFMCRKAKDKKSESEKWKTDSVRVKRSSLLQMCLISTAALHSHTVQTHDHHNSSANQLSAFLHQPHASALLRRFSVWLTAERSWTFHKWEERNATANHGEEWDVTSVKICWCCRPNPDEVVQMSFYPSESYKQSFCCRFPHVWLNHMQL